ncbi:MAG TPA: cell wall hydrolase [Xanthobacteraceae bacterium]|nr:cell wall hydrolase [Xanthobacteraceae bacterium]
MRIPPRRRQFGPVLLLAALLTAGGSTAIARQDLAGLLAHQPGIAARARLVLNAGSFSGLKIAAFGWPSANLAIPAPPPSLPLGIVANRAAKGDRLMPAAASAPTSSPAATVASLAADSGPAGTSTDTGEGEIAAGDPTGDPSEFDEAVLEDSVSAVAVDAPDTEAPLFRQAAFIFGADPDQLPPQRFEHRDDGGTSIAAKGEVTGPDAAPRSLADRLGLDGRRRERAETCLAEAVYFESRGEPERGQVAVAQVVMNRVFSGYYPADVCRTVYQNANRRLACQFTFACDAIKDVVTEPVLWRQARRIAADMLDGRIWDDKVGKATHYHAMSVRPFWIREMRKLDRIGEHTFYRPRRWQG